MAVDVRQLRQRFENLKGERSLYEREWLDLRDFIMPECGRFHSAALPSIRNDRWEKILDATATDAAEVLGAGMLGGMTSPARPWFQLTTSSPELDEQYEVKRWLTEVTTQMQMIFSASNVYEALHRAYLELAVFGTACVVAVPSEKHVIRLEPLTIGEYWIAENHEGLVDTLYREVYMTAQQMIQAFGRNACSKRVRNSYDNNKRQERFSIIHAIEPRLKFDAEKIDKENMPWLSVYFERDTADTPGAALLEEGFTHFPALCPRWLVKGSNTYGTGPGAKALPQVKALQGMHLDMSYGIGYMARPPLQVPAELEGRDNDWSPGGVVYITNANASNPIQSAINVNFNLQHLDALIQRAEKKVENFFFKDLFMLITNSARADRTAYEVEQLEKEKMMLMGPVLERLHTELLGPLIDSAFDFMMAFGKMPPIPEALRGQTLTVSYISVLALAQKATALNGFDRVLGTIANITQVMPEAHVGDLFDADDYLRKVADMLGVDPDVLRSGDQVLQIRQERADQMAQQQQMAQAQQMAQVAGQLSSVQQNPAAAQAGTLQSLQGY